MEVRKTLKDIAWIKPWPSPRASPEASELMRQCAAEPVVESADVDLQEIIAQSKKFPIAFPIDTVRLEKLKLRCPVERLKSNAQSTYPLLHERVVLLIANFLIYKRKYGSAIEKALYKDMTIAGFVDRLLKKRAVTFMKAQDQYKLLNGKAGKEGWESVGTANESPPLLLKDCLSYDEMKISALVYVSGYTECINDGARKNCGKVQLEGVEGNAVIIGIVGPRFKRPQRMEYEDMLVTREQNLPARGYGPGAVGGAKRAWRQLWEDFYQVPSITYSELTSQTKLVPCTGRRVFGNRWAGVRGAGFDNQVFCRRMLLTADVVLLEAEARAAEARKSAFVNVIGAGLGIWKHSPHQIDVFVLAVLERIATLLDAGALNNVADVNFAYIDPKRDVLELFKAVKSRGDDSTVSVRKLFLKNNAHPRGGINVQLESREPSAQLSGEHEGKLLVLTYPWDSNAHPGNEFWVGKLSSSGDSAAACATQVAELHNAHVNARLTGAKARVAGHSLRTIQTYCKEALGGSGGTE